MIWVRRWKTHIKEVKCGNSPAKQTINIHLQFSLIAKVIVRDQTAIIARSQSVNNSALFKQLKVWLGQWIETEQSSCFIVINNDFKIKGCHNKRRFLNTKSNTAIRKRYPLWNYSPNGTMHCYGIECIYVCMKFKMFSSNYYVWFRSDRYFY